MRTRFRRSTALALVAVLAGTLTGWPSGPAQAQTPSGSTLTRPADAVVVTGQQVSQLNGTAPNRLVAFATSGTGWAQIPVQVDERKTTSMASIYNLPATQTFYGSSINVQVNVYADPNTFTGADTDPNLDADDEIAFMTRDAGGPRGDRAAPTGTTGNPVEIKLDDPMAAGQTGYVYLFASNGSLDPGAGKQYVNYQFRLNSGDYRTTYNRTNGPNPENSTVTGASYTTHFSDRWTQDALTSTRGNRPNADLIDRVKYDIELACARNENTFNDEEGAFVVNKSGPVRALRSYVGSNSGPNTQNTHAFYDTFSDVRTDLRVHAIPNVRAHVDLSREAFGMTMRTPQNTTGVPIDGQPDNLGTQTPTWWTISGQQGGLAVSARYDQNATTAPVRWYEDNAAAPSVWQCTGDGEAIGDTGAFFNSWIGCTDPGLACTQRLSGGYRTIITGADTPPAELQRQAEHYQRPLTVTVNGQGPGPDPGGQCFTATNSAHVAAGRATSWLVFTWANGSNTYLGATWATTSLRQTAPNTWQMVASCA
jgi:hypothetical protein